MSKLLLATCWLDECSGCHMSLLDLDERLIALADKVQVVYGPLVDAKELPEMVDVFIVAGSISSDDDLHKIKEIRKRAKVLVALGDCAVTGNVPAMRNTFGPAAAIQRAYLENAAMQPQKPGTQVPALLPRVMPLHEAVHVDTFIQGCPPVNELIYFILCEVLEGRQPGRGIRTRFG